MDGEGSRYASDGPCLVTARALWLIESEQFATLRAHLEDCDGHYHTLIARDAGDRDAVRAHRRALFRLYNGTVCALAAEGGTAPWDEANVLLHRMLAKRIHPSKKCIDRILDGTRMWVLCGCGGEMVCACMCMHVCVRACVCACMRVCLSASETITVH